MKEHVVLKEIALALTDEEIDFVSITNAIKEYKDLLAGLSDIDLKDEQQVPITINLMNQLGDKAILIPQNITLKLALINSGKQTVNLIDNNTGEYKKVIGNIFELNAVTSRSYVKEVGNTFDFPSLHFL